MKNIHIYSTLIMHVLIALIDYQVNKIVVIDDHLCMLTVENVSLRNKQRSGGLKTGLECVSGTIYKQHSCTDWHSIHCTEEQAENWWAEKRG